MILEHGGKIYLLSPLRGDAPPEAAAISPRIELESMFRRFTSETLRLVAISFAAMALALLVLFRRRFPGYVATVAAAIIMTAGSLGLLGAKITFFHVLCFFVMTGIGIDYVIFHYSCAEKRNGRETATIVLFSFLTSLAGFGALGFLRSLSGFSSAMCCRCRS